MKLLVNYVIQDEKKHIYDSEKIEINIRPVMYAFQIKESDIETEIVKWVEQKQNGLNGSEKVVVLKTFRLN